MAQTPLLRDAIGVKSITELNHRLIKSESTFNGEQFLKLALNDLSSLGLNERINQVKAALKICLPSDFEKAAKVLVGALGPKLSQESLDGIDLTSPHGFIVLASCEYVASFGQESFSVSMWALEEMTQRFSAEGAIRSFITNHPENTFTQLKKWMTHDSVHVRRLVSEGTRPRLPLFSRLPEFVKDPSPVLNLLDQLKDDNELYVRRSVANNLNDIAKDNPEQVTNLLEKWSVGASKERQWLIKHALRSLLKQGNKAALSLLGFKGVNDLQVNKFEINSQHITLGQELEISLNLSSESTLPNNLMIDYLVFHKKANGSLAPKVFKWTQRSLSKGKPIVLNKKHPIKKISTRKYYSGAHEIHLQVNGEILASCDFHLQVGD